MQALKPCARCEQELPESFFDSDDAFFCKRCNQEVTEIMRKKYSVIEAAYFRAQMRHSNRKLRQRMSEKKPAAVGD